ncbi:MAG: hypothetical protein Kow0032_13950 [Methyloligellaceae bacterium]
MRGLKRLFLGVVLLSAVMVAVAFALPRNVSVERAEVINAPESDIFVYLNSPKKFNDWSPWAEKDPDAHYIFSGPPAGKGAGMAWDSDNPQVGSGRQEIVESVENRSVKVALDFGDQGTATATFELVPAGAGTKVIWRFSTDTGNNPLKRWAGLLFDRWVGAEYERGLARLKELVETQGGGR